MGAFKTTWEYNRQIAELKKKAPIDMTFMNFCPFTIAKFARGEKQNKATAKSVHFGIANAAVEAEEAQANTAWAVAEVVTEMQDQQKQNTKEMREMFKTMLTSIPAIQGVLPVQPNTCTKHTKFTHSECPHRKQHHPNCDKCWELKANKDK
jgi:hypothetical protein